jgi:HSP20 family protein
MALLPRRLRSEHPLASFRTEFDRLFDDFFGNFLPEKPALALPVVDIAEKDDRIELHAELAGVKPEDVSVSADEDTVTIKGEKKVEREEKNTNWFVTERSYGSFTRVLQLPALVDAAKAKASFKDGVLTVTLPKRPEAQVRKVDIKVE